MRLMSPRRQRALHPAGRSMTGELRVWGCPRPVGSTLLDMPGLHRVTVRLSKGLGTRGDRPDVRGVAIRVARPEGVNDLLLSTVGLFGRVPVPRRSFDADYGTITPYRAGLGKVHLAAGPDRTGRPIGRSLDALDAGGGLILYAVRDGVRQPFGKLTLGAFLPATADAELAFDPIRNTTEDLYPTGRLHATRAFAYRLSQRWRGARPAPSNPPAVARTATNR
ncbi:hypothetical protein [Actinoplanes sp. NPDC049802]|uniref:hypothetical protein n=1 Tax=Actinoplanes sp. NPDC049802 TaxID=3154742 RepID=UPI0033C076B5